MPHEPGAPYNHADPTDDETVPVPEDGTTSMAAWLVPVLLFIVGSAVYLGVAGARQLGRWHPWFLWPMALATVGSAAGVITYMGWWPTKRRALIAALGVATAGMYIHAAAVIGPSPDTHFTYLADTLNTMVAAPFSEAAADKREGKKPFELNRDPPHRNDWASYWEIKTDGGRQYRGVWLGNQGQGRFKTLEGEVFAITPGSIDSRNKRYFVSFPPGPAVVMMPLVAAWGYDVSDIVLTALFAALNLVLLYLVLRRLAAGGRSGRSLGDNLWLVILFAFGTAHFWCSIMGQVWFTALIMGITFTLLYIYFSIDTRRPFLAGCALAAAFATRAPLVFSAIFFFAMLTFPGGSFRKQNWGTAIKKGALFCAPCLIVGIGLLAMNVIRFESITEFGHRYLATGTLQRIEDYGLFNVHFLSKNLSAMLTLLPQFLPEPPYIKISKHGMSIFAATPALVYLFWPRSRESAADRFWWRTSWATIAVLAIPALFYQNTGFAQFSYRFILDYLPYLMILLAVGRHRITWPFRACIVASIVINSFGAWTFKHVGQFYMNGYGQFFS